jgi:hypothetical protein
MHYLVWYVQKKLLGSKQQKTCGANFLRCSIDQAFFTTRINNVVIECNRTHGWCIMNVQALQTTIHELILSMQLT